MTSFNRKPMVLAMAGAMLYTRDKSGAPFARPIHTRDTGSLDENAQKLKTRMEKLDKLIKDHEDRLENLPDDVKAELEARSKEIKDLAAVIKGIQQEMVDGVNSRGADPDTTAAILIRNTEAVKIAAEILAKRDRKSVSFEGIQARNIISLGSMNGNPTLAGNDLARTVIQQLNVIDLINWGTTTIDVVPLLRESGYDIMADIVPEGALKPESNLNFGTTELKIGVIAHWVRVTNQVLADMPMLANYIESRLSYGVRLKLEYFVIKGHQPASGQLKHFSGLMEAGNYETVTPAVDDTDMDVLNRAKYKAALSMVKPECYILNPEDWGNIERIKGDDGHYVYGTPGATGVQVWLWGLPVVFSAAQDLGDYWCGNLSIGYDGYIREEVDVRISTEDGDNFRKNLATVLAEMRAAGGVVIPDANVAGELPSKV